MSDDEFDHNKKKERGIVKIRKECSLGINSKCITITLRFMKNIQMEYKRNIKRDRVVDEKECNCEEKDKVFPHTVKFKLMPYE